MDIAPTARDNHRIPANRMLQDHMTTAHTDDFPGAPLQCTNDIATRHYK